MTDFVIHGIPGSPYVRTPLLALEEKGLPWRLAAVPMGGNRAPEYRSIHPFNPHVCLRSLPLAPNARDPL